MAYKLRRRETKIRELDAFLADYRRICRRHGLRLEQGTNHDGFCYLTIACWDGSGALQLDLDEAQDVPCVDRALQKLNDVRKRELAAQDRAFQRAVKSARPGEPLELLEAALPYLNGYEGIDDLRLRVAATINQKRGRRGGKAG